MKKLYYLDESEKDRILELHKKRTNQQYLTEQIEWTDKKGLKYAEPGKWTENAYDEFYSFLYQNKGSRGKFMKGIRKWCNDSILNKELGTPTLKKAALTRVVTDIGAILNASKNWVGLSENDITQMQNRLKQLENMPNFCHALQLKDTNRSGEDLVNMMDEIYNNNWFFKVVGTIEELAENTKKSGEASPDDKKKEDETKNDAQWSQYYPCIEKQKYRFQSVPNRPDLKLGNMVRVKVSDAKNPATIDGKVKPGFRGEKDRTIDAYFFLDGGYVLLNEAESKDYSGTFMCRQQRFTADSDIVIFPGRSPNDEGGGSADETTESKWTCSAPIPAASTNYPCVESPRGEYSSKEECESKSKYCKGKTSGGGGGGGVPTPVSDNLCYSWGCVTKKVNNQLGGVNQQTINDMANKLGIKK